MMDVIRWLFGTVSVEMHGRDVSLLLNRAAQNGVHLTGLYYRQGAVTGTMRPKDFLRLFPLRHRLSVRIELKEKIGLPFVIFRNRRRFGFLLGILLFFTVLLVLNSFIWVVEVTGNTAVSSAEICRDCAACGVKIGIPKNKVFPLTAAEKLLLQNHKLSWASVNCAGCVATVNVQEIDHILPPERQIGNLIASCDGVVTQMDVVAGTTAVGRGDAVRAGDLLVSGLVEHADRIDYLRASGNVIADTQPVFTAEWDVAKPLIIPTGKQRTQIQLMLFGIKIPLSLGTLKQPCETQIRTEKWVLFGRDMPIAVTVKKQTQLRKEKQDLTEDAVLEKLRNAVRDQIKKADLIEYEIVSEKFEKNGNHYELRENLRAKQNIAKFVPILVHTSN